MPLSNSSLLDEATAAAEAMHMCHAVAPDGKNGFFVAADCHPQTIDVVKTRAEALAGYIQQAIDAAAAGRRRLSVPAGLYNIAPVETFASEAGPCRRCLAIRSHMALQAVPGASFRIVDRISTDQAPVFMCMFGTNEQLSDVSWRGLELDMNGQNNPISPRRDTAGLPHNGYSLVNQAHIYVTGASAAGGAARIVGATVAACRLVNTPGVSCIVMGQSNAVGSELGSGWVVQRCVFRNNGFDTVDHSTIYGWAENVTITDNDFSNDRPFSVTGGLVAYEVHGANTTFARNRVANYYQGMWLDGNGTRDVTGTRVMDNVFDRLSAFGIMFFGQSKTASAVRDTLIEGNTIVLDDADVGAVDLKYGIGTAGRYSVTDVRVRNNMIRGIGTSRGKVGIAVVAGDVAGQKHDRWIIENNRVATCAIGIAATTSTAATLGTIEIRANRTTDLTPMGPFRIAQGVSYTGRGRAIERLVIERNICSDDRAVPQCAFGIRLEGPIGILNLRENVAHRMTIAPYAAVAGTTGKGSDRR